MHRNLDRRVETLVRLVEPQQQRAISALFDLAMDPDTSAWDLDGDGAWSRRESGEPGDKPSVDLQNTLIEERADWWSRRQ